MSSANPTDAHRRLLVVHHTPSPGMQAMLESVLSGAQEEGIEGVEVTVRPALSASASDVLHADGYLLGTPINIGYMSGALKHFFDQVYYPILGATRGRPYGLYVHGNEGLEGGLRSVESIVSAFGWTPVSPPVEAMGPVDSTVRDACRELGAVLAGTIMPE